MTNKKSPGESLNARKVVAYGRARNLLNIPTAIAILTLLAAACSAETQGFADATRSAQTIAQMITDVAFQRTAEPSPTPTSYAPARDASTATTGPTLTPTVIATVALSSPTSYIHRATYSGSTPTTNATSLLTRTLTTRCNAAFFVGYVPPILENAEVGIEEKFTLIWEIRNVGTCTWYPSYMLYWHSGAHMEAPAYINFPEIIPPNQVLFLSVNMVAPDVPGSYYQRWYIRDPDYVQFGIGPNFDQPLMVRIVVVA
jgi:hypothetical protein